MSDPDRWGPRAILQLVGWGCILAAVVLVFPTVGHGSGKGHEPGSDTIRGLLIDSSLGRAVLILASIGVVVLLLCALVRTNADG